MISQFQRLLCRTRFHRSASKNSRGTRSSNLAAEQLEPRVVLDARVLITEVVANNNQGLEDEDGERSDWIELYNSGDSIANLNGWHLTDDPTNSTKWTLPEISIAPEQFQVIFASGKNRTNPSDPLHTNFQLDAAGEYLGLNFPGGTSTAFEFAPQFPALDPDRSFGIAQEVTNVLLIEENSETRALVPSPENGGDQLGLTWTERDFDDTGWSVNPGGVGFDNGSGFDTLIGNDLKAEMEGVNSSAYIRIPFENPGAISSLNLRIKYDDGFAAFLNGIPVASRNAPPVLTWESDASSSHRNALAREFEDIDLSSSIHQLQENQNILAIQGMNSSLGSNDFLISVELQGTRPGPIVSETPAFFERTTPNQANGSVSYEGLVAGVSASVERGFYDGPFDVTLASATIGSSMVYTTNGSAPTLDNGTVIAPADPTSAPSTIINIASTTTLRAAAFKESFLPSLTNTQTYLMLDDVISQDFQSTIDAGFPDTWKRTEPDYGLDPDVVGPDDKFEGEFASQIIDALKAAPTVSIVTDLDFLFGDEEGIYVNSVQTGFEWERPTSVEIIMPDGTTDVQADAGIRIAGDNVRNFANSKKQSMRLEFRERYGPTKLRFPLFGEDAADSFDTLILRGGYNDSWVHTPNSTQYIRDHWARTTLLEMGRPQAHGKFVHVYLNGFYWGMYNAVERPNASFSATYFGGDKDEWDALNTGTVRDGDIGAWNELRALSRDVNVDDQQESNAAYLKLLGRNPDGTENPNLENLLDVGHYIDYLIVNFYGGNTDWPGRNYYVGRQRGPDSTGFKFYAWDTEKILDHGEGSDLNTNQTNSGDGVAVAYRSLLANDEFRLLFADHIHRHFFNGGALAVDPNNPSWDPEYPERNVPAARYDRLASEVELALVAESARWGDTQSSSTRNDGRVFTVHDWQAKRDNLNERYFPRRSEIVLRQFVNAELYPTVAAPVYSQHGGTIEPGFNLSMEAVGEIYYTLDGTDPRRSALEPGVDESGVSPNAILYPGAITLDTTTIVKARTLIDGQWSALNEARFELAPLPLRVSEIMYHPRPAEAGGDDEDFEFIEVVNVSMTETIDLAGVQFADGIEFTFSEKSLAPGEMTVVVRNVNAFQQRYGANINIAGEYGNTPADFKLSNSGERIRLIDNSGTVIQEFNYDDAWYPSTDGDGRSLTIVDSSAGIDAWNAATGWRASTSIDGSPGTQGQNVDFNDDGVTDVQDVDLLCEGIRSNDSQFDLTGDGIVDQFDLEALIQGALGTNVGDANLDGVFDSRDLVTVFQVNEYEDDFVGNSTWSDGDWNCDGEFNSRDLVTAFIAGSFVAAAKPSLSADDVSAIDEIMERSFL